MSRLSFLKFALLGGALASTALAQTPPPSDAGSEEVVVTAQKRSQKLQDVPIAITALSGKTLRDKHVTDVMDLNQLAPTLQVKTDDNAANPKIFIRGIGLNDFNPTASSAVAIYTDGVYIGSPLAQMSQFFDLDRVEVLRGPQGTLYGRNTTGGAINIIAKKPTPDWSADASVEYGRFHRLSAETGFGGPLVDGLLNFRLSGAYVKDNGYTLNRLTGDYGNDTDRGSVRLQFDYTPSENFEALVQFRAARSKGGSIQAYHRSLLPLTAAAAGPDGLCAPDFYTSGQCGDLVQFLAPGLGYSNTSTNLYQGDYLIDGTDEVDTYGASATLNWDLGPVKLVSVSAYDNADRDDVEATDASPDQTINARYRNQQWVVSEELRLQSNGEGPLTYVAGLYYAHDHLENDSYYNVLDVFLDPEPGNPSGGDLASGIGRFGWPFTQSTNSYAAFGQLDYKITDKLTGTIGLRYSADDKKFYYQSVYQSGNEVLFTIDDSKNFGSLSGKLGLQYQLNDDVNFYASYNRGYKSGGFFGAQTTDPANLKPYGDEKVNAYEIGAKTQWFDRKLTANFSAFYYDYKDLQVYTLIKSPTPPNLDIQLFTNASAARDYGFEAEFSAHPIQGLDLTASFAYLDATYQDFKSLEPGSPDYSGNRLPNAPHWSIVGSARYEWAMLNGLAHIEADADYRSKIYYDTTNAERLSDKGRVFVNGQIGFKPDAMDIEVGVWARNIFNETNISDIIPIAGLGFDLFSMGPPRSAGIYARFSY